jgi:hypothetical protein
MTNSDVPTTWSRKKFWNFKLHIEFRLFDKNSSGIGLRGRYEVQIAADYGRQPTVRPTARSTTTSLERECKQTAGQWQAMDITLIGRDVTVVLNG